eukprot:1353658-Karenia_brevis.AAC.1
MKPPRLELPDHATSPRQWVVGAQVGKHDSPIESTCCALQVLCKPSIARNGPSCLASNIGFEIAGGQTGH